MHQAPTPTAIAVPRWLVILGSLGIAGHLFGAWRQWCQATGEEEGNQRSFGQAMTERGFERYTSNGTRYRGVAPREPADDGAAEEPMPG